MMADFREVKLSTDAEKRVNSAGNNDVDRLDDYHEAEFKGATLSLTSDGGPSPVSSGQATGGSGQDSSPNENDALAPSTHSENLGSCGGATSTSHRLPPVRGFTEEDIREFFANGALENAAQQCQPVILENLDGALQGFWLLTEIDHWDTEKERLVFLTDYSLLLLKYDFITLKLLEYRRLHLKDFDKVIIGELKYPENSLMPKINGAVDFIKGRVIPKIRHRAGESTTAAANQAGSGPAAASELKVADETHPTSGSFLEEASPQQQGPPTTDTRPRNQIGVRCMWNQDQPLPFLKNWNPWSREIPYVTFTSHPLVKQEGLSGSKYDIEHFSNVLAQTVERLDITQAPPHNTLTPLKTCSLHYQPVTVENYAGILSAFHNANDFGFFKARGKVSF